MRIISYRKVLVNPLSQPSALRYWLSCVVMYPTSGRDLAKAAYMQTKWTKIGWEAGFNQLVLISLASITCR